MTRFFPRARPELVGAIDPFGDRVHTRERAGLRHSSGAPLPGWWQREQMVLQMLAVETARRGPLEAARALFRAPR